MRDDNLNIQLKKALIRCQIVWLSEYMPSQAINMIIRYKRFMTRDIYRFGVYKSFNKLEKYE